MAKVAEEKTAKKVAEGPGSYAREECRGSTKKVAGFLPGVVDQRYTLIAGGVDLFSQ